MADAKDILPRRQVIYCGACCMPVEYCEYSPDYETHCLPWLRKHHPDLVPALITTTYTPSAAATAAPSKPWTTEERLMAFYQKYVPEKLDSVPALLEKYAGKEDKLFQALVSKYGPEPQDPYFSDDEDDDDNDNDMEGAATPAAAVPGRNKRRGASAKKDDGDTTTLRILIQKVALKKKRTTTIVSGLDGLKGVKLKDISKQFAKKFAGSSSVSKNNEVVVQGDHVYEAAEMLVDSFKVPEDCIYLDLDGEIVPLK